MNRKLTKIAVTAAAGLVVVALAVPYLGADRFVGTVRAELQQALGREVEINGTLRFHVLPWPGFSADNVVIHDVDAYGVEPIAYVSTLEVQVRLLGLMMGHIEASGIRLVEPSINLTLSGTSGWNFQPLLDHTLGNSTTRARLPGINVEGGRINVKFGDVKSSLYLADTDLTLETDSGRPGRFDIRLSGEPTETNRPARALGTFSGRGWVEPGAAGGGRGDISLALQRTAIAELMTLVEGRPSSLGGFLTSRARLSGPLGNMAIEGSVELDQVERLSWLFPDSSRWALDLGGSFDLPGRAILVETRTPKSGQLPVSVRIRGTGLLSQPQWGATLGFHDLAFSSLRSIAEETGATLPTELPVEGKLTGALGYSPPEGLRGQLLLTEGRLALSESQVYEIDPVEMIVDGPIYRLNPANLHIGENQTLRVEALYDIVKDERDIRMRATAMRTDAFRAAWERMSQDTMPPAMAACRGGAWSGALRYSRQGQLDATWTGQAELTGAQCRIAGLSQPLELHRAAVSLQGPSFAMRKVEGSVEGLAVTGSYSHDPRAGRADRLDLNIDGTSLGQLQRLFTPSLRRSQGLLARTLGRTAPAPEWLRNRSVEAHFEIGTLEVAGHALQNASGLLVWDGLHAEVEDFAATADGGKLGGILRVHLDGSNPVYSAMLDLQKLPWGGGEIEAEWQMRTSGMGNDLWGNMNLDGSFWATGVALTPDVEGTSAGGSFLFNKDTGGKLEMNAVYANIGQDDFRGSGSAWPDGRLAVDLQSAQKQMKLSGRFSETGIELAAAR